MDQTGGAAVTRAGSGRRRLRAAAGEAPRPAREWLWPALRPLGRLAGAVAESARFGLWLLVEPQETFYQLKTRGSVAAACVVMALVLAVRVATFFTTAFPFSSAEPWEVDFLAELARTVGPWASWVVANYGVTAVLYGEGTFRQIFVASAYCFVPYVLLALPVSLVTHALTLGERALVDAAMAVVYGWVGLLVLLSVKVVHNYEWRQTLGVVALSLAAMLAMWAVVAMVYGLTDQVAHFVREVWREALIR